VCGQEFSVKVKKRQATCGGPCSQKYVKMLNEVDKLRKWRNKKKIVQKVKHKDEVDEDLTGGGE
jgi:hypothetical protein